MSPLVRLGVLLFMVGLVPGTAPSAAAASSICARGTPAVKCHSAPRPARHVRHRAKVLASKRVRTPIPIPAVKPTPVSLPPASPLPTRPQSASDDLSEARQVPDNIHKIMADPRIEPVIAYLLRQAARKPIGDWTVRQLQQVAAVVSTLPESGIPMADIQALYEFLGLDPSDVFNPQLGDNWQDSSTRFDRSGAAAVASISSADCQMDPGEITVAVSRSCQSGEQQ
jgi:hypothetical protein